MIRVVWWLAVAALAGIAIVAALDRATVSKPQLAAFVPAPFRSFAQPTMTMLSLASGSPESARAEAVTLVRKRPIPAENVYVLALVDLTAGDKAGYARAFKVATTRGWRAVPIQIAAADAAIARGDAALAALRVAAVMAVDAGNGELPRLVNALVTLPGGAQALGDAVARTRSPPPTSRLF